MINSPLLGIFLPPIIDLINKRITNQKVRFLVSALLCIALGALLTFEELKIGNTEELINSSLIIFASAQSVYHLFWKTSELRQTVLK